jgi:stage II sporulation protein D
VSLRRAPRHVCGALLLVARPALAAAVVALLAASLAGFVGGCGYLGHGNRAGEETDDRTGVGRSAVPELSAQFPEYAVTSGAPMIRVGLAQGVPEASVSGRGRYGVRLYSDKLESWTAQGGQTWRFRGQSGLLSGSGPSAEFDAEAGTIRIAPEVGELLIFEGVPYRGEIEIFSSAPGSLTVVNVLDLEAYHRGVVPGEIGARPVEELEAVKAQAVAARTYAVASGGRRGRGGFDVLATVEDQVYRGADVEDPLCDRAVLETAGEFLAWDGQPIHAYFHSTCGGRTEAREEVWELPRVPYLTQVWDSPEEDRFTDPFCGGAPYFIWSERWTGDEIERLVRDQLPSTASTPVRGTTGEVRDIRITVRTPSGRVRWLEVETDAGTYRVFGDRVRWLLRRPAGGGILRSAWFDLDVGHRGGRVSEVVASGRGYGHGVGLCQHGAMEMARRGYTYAQILAHYYPGATLARLVAGDE